MKKKILIIKHGSFGDVVLSTGAIKSIKNHFSNYAIYLLTSSKYASFMKYCPNVNQIIIDDRKPFYYFINHFLLLKNILRHHFEYIIDLQNSKRTFWYNLIFKFFTKSIISSSRPMAHFRYIIPPQGYEHVTTGLKNQLFLIGIRFFFEPDVEWLIDEKVNNQININKPYVIIIPGTSKRGFYKRWSSNKYAELSNYLLKNNLSVVVAGNTEDYSSALPILKLCPKAYNFLGKSPPSILYNLAKKAKFVISNDTGPALLVSLSNTPLVWIVNDNAVSSSNKPTGKKIIKISSKSIKNISTIQVINEISKKKLI